MVGVHDSSIYMFMLLINDDCFNYFDKIKDSSIDLVLIDPPYLISRDSFFKNHSDDLDKFLVNKYNMSMDFGDWDKVDIDWDILFGEYYRILKKGGTLIVFFDIWKSNIIKSYAEKNKFKQPRICTWVKNNPVPINSKVNYLSNSSEFFFTFVKGGKPTFNSVYDNGIYNYPLCHGKERLNHPTQKPLRLISDLILKHSNPGDIVLDTFAGSGTTGEASIINNRDCILIEKDKIYFEILSDRLSTKNQISNI